MSAIAVNNSARVITNIMIVLAFLTALKLNDARDNQIEEKIIVINSPMPNPAILIRITRNTARAFASPLIIDCTSENVAKAIIKPTTAKTDITIDEINLPFE